MRELVWEVTSEVGPYDTDKLKALRRVGLDEAADLMQLELDECGGKWTRPFHCLHAATSRRVEGVGAPKAVCHQSPPQRSSPAGASSGGVATHSVLLARAQQRAEPVQPLVKRLVLGVLDGVVEKGTDQVGWRVRIGWRG